MDPDLDITSENNNKYSQNQDYQSSKETRPSAMYSALKGRKIQGTKTARKHFST